MSMGASMTVLKVPVGAATAITSATAVKIVSANGARTHLRIKELTGQPVRLGGPDVATTSGWVLAASSEIAWDAEACPTGDIYAIATSTSGSVQVMEVIG